MMTTKDLTKSGSPKVSGALMAKLKARGRPPALGSSISPATETPLKKATKLKSMPISVAPTAKPRLSKVAPSPVVHLLMAPTTLRTQPKRPKRLIATLTGIPFSSKSKKRAKLKQAEFTVGSGVLFIGSKELTHAQPVILGTAAAIAGVTSVILKADALPPEGLRLDMRSRQQRELDSLGYSVQYFFKQFRTGFDVAKNSHKWAREMVDRWQKDYWAPACELLPPEMRVLTGLRRGVYGDDGQPMTAKQIEQRARSKRVLDAFKGALAKIDETGPELDIVLAGTTRLLPDRKGDDEPVVYTPVAEAMLKKLVAKFEFGMLPLTLPQLNEFFEHVNNKILLTGGDALLRGI